MKRLGDYAGRQKKGQFFHWNHFLKIDKLFLGKTGTTFQSLYKKIDTFSEYLILSRKNCSNK